MSESYPAFAVLLKREDGGEFLARDCYNVVRHWWHRQDAQNFVDGCTGRVVRVTVEVRVEGA